MSKIRSVRAWFLSNWIEWLAVPIASNIMEAQPVVVVLVFFTSVFTDGQGTPFLSEATIILLLLGLQWWAMLVKYFTPQSVNEQSERLLYLLGLLLAATLVIATPLLAVKNVLTVILASALILRFWWYGISRTRKGLSNEQIVTAFRIGFIILLIALIVSVAYLDASYATLFATLARALPLFFLSGLLGLSFTRIGLVRQQNAHYGPESSQLGATRSWLITLTLLWIGVVVAVVTLETFSFQSIAAAVMLLWYGLGLLVNFILYIIVLIITPIFYVIGLVIAYVGRFFHSNPTSRPSYTPLRHPASPTRELSPEFILASRFILLLLAFIVLALIVRIILRRWRRTHKDEEVEEVREGLSVRAIVHIRRQERQRRNIQQPTTTTFEPLDPSSARAYYRELLQTMATHQVDFARQPDETPDEYRARLLTFVKKDSSNEQESPADTAILDTLTHAYDLERYGEKHLDTQKQLYLQKWAPYLLERLKLLVERNRISNEF